VRKIEFGELRVTDLAKSHIAECLENNWVSIGPKVKLFEEKCAQIFNYPYTTMVSSGTSADIAACMALYEFGAKPGDYIICPALSFIATANAIRAAGFEPWFVDVKKETLNIDEEEVRRTLRMNAMAKAFDSVTNLGVRNIVGIMAVNLMGNPCRMDILSDLAKQYNIKLIIDNCEAYGCQLNGKFSLDYADMETTSHYIAHIICSAEGGTVSSKDKVVNDAIQSVRSHGRQPGSLFFDHQRYGLNLKPTDLNASIGLGEIDDFWKIFARRKEILYKYYNATAEFADKVYFVQERAGCINAPHGFSITIKPDQFTEILKTALIKQELEKAGIHWKKNFGSMPQHGCFKDHFQHKHSFPNAEYVGNYGIHIGCHYWMTDEDVDYVCETLRNILKSI
jgi:perosamine synthetase